MFQFCRFCLFFVVVWVLYYFIITLNCFTVHVLMYAVAFLYLFRGPGSFFSSENSRAKNAMWREQSDGVNKNTKADACWNMCISVFVIWGRTGGNSVMLRENTVWHLVCGTLSNAFVIFYIRAERGKEITIIMCHVFIRRYFLLSRRWASGQAHRVVRALICFFTNLFLLPVWWGEKLSNTIRLV